MSPALRRPSASPVKTRPSSVTRARVTHRWSGIWGQTGDLLPLAGRVPGTGRLWVAGGYSGHGNVLGFACGRLVAGALLGESSPQLELFEPARFS